jgi:3-hydroxyisobutyrate dehydrogenase
MNILAETLNACAYLGLSEEKFLEIINSGPLATVVSKGKGPNIIQGKFQTAFPFEHLLKDVTYTLSLIDEKKLPLISLMKRQYESGLEKEKGKDFSAIYNYYSNLYK